MNAAPVANTTARPTLTRYWSAVRRYKVGVGALAIILAFALMTVAHPILMHTVWDPNVYDPVTGYGFDQFIHPSPPSSSHLLGTDPLGRDVLSQLMYSSRSAFILAIIAALVTLSIGTVVGAASAYYGRFVDALLMRFADIVVMMPTISLLVVLGAFVNLNIIALAIVIGAVSGFGGTAIVLKSQALTITVRSYVEASRVAGGSSFHIIRTHVIPNLLPLASLYMMFTVTTAILVEGVLSFFGLIDVQMSWGVMVNTAQTSGYLSSGFRYWWLLMPAGVSMTLMTGSFYLLGRSLDEIINPRLRTR